MINLSEFILEKFKITKDIDTSYYTLIEKAEDEEYVKTIKGRSLWPEDELKDREKMQAYHDKGSKPSRLISTIKDNDKLFRRFCAAVRMKWEDAINDFGQALIDRNIYKEEDIIKYIFNYYKK